MNHEQLQFHHINHKLEKIMSAVTDLTAAVANLDAAVAAALAKLSAPPADDPAVVAAAAEVQKQADALKAASA